MPVRLEGVTAWRGAVGGPNGRRRSRFTRSRQRRSSPPPTVEIGVRSRRGNPARARMRAVNGRILMQIGPYRIEPRLILAPMAGVTDKPFRRLCKRLGAGYAVSEMTASNPQLWETRKSRLRMDHDGEPAPIGVQIAGVVVVAFVMGNETQHVSSVVGLPGGARECASSHRVSSC